MTEKFAISVKSLIKQYGKFTAVDGISFKVKSGEIFSLLGPNGAGKTTIVEIIECLKKPTKGEVEVFGINIRDLKKQINIKRKIGVMPQNFNAFDWLTVKENLEYFKNIYSSNKSVVKLIEDIGLDGKTNALYKTLSGGMKQRLGIAISLINEPELLFLDEPTAGLDPQARRDTWNLIRKLKEQGKTIFLTTHYMEEAQELSDRILIIINGKIVTDGSPNKLIEEFGGKKLIILRNCKESLLENHSLEYEINFKGEVQIPFENNEHLFKILNIFTDIPDIEIEIKKPDLNEVFLNLTGKRMTAEGLVK